MVGDETLLRAGRAVIGAAAQASTLLVRGSRALSEVALIASLGMGTHQAVQYYRLDQMQVCFVVDGRCVFFDPTLLSLVAR